MLGDLRDDLAYGPTPIRGVEHMGQFMMKNLQQLQTTQTKVVELLMGTREPRSLKGLQGGVNLNETTPRANQRELGLAAIADGDLTPDKTPRFGSNSQSLAMVPSHGQPTTTGLGSLPQYSEIGLRSSDGGPAPNNGQPATTHLGSKPQSSAMVQRSSDGEPAPDKATSANQSKESSVSPPRQASAICLQPAEKKRRLACIMNRSASSRAQLASSGHGRRENVSNAIVDMLAERDAEAKEERAAKARAARAKAAETEPNAAPRDMCAAAKGKGAGQGKRHHVQKQRKGKATEAKTKPRVDFEGSRDQYLGRTGLRGPGQSVSFRFGGGVRAQYSSKEDAKRAAHEWLARQTAALRT